MLRVDIGIRGADENAEAKLQSCLRMRQANSHPRLGFSLEIMH